MRERTPGGLPCPIPGAWPVLTRGVGRCETAQRRCVLTASSVLLLSGGHGWSVRHADPAVQEALQWSGSNTPRVAYVGAASEDDRDFFQWAVRRLRLAGAATVELVPLAGRKPDTEKARQLLAGADVVFVNGGDVEAGVEYVRKAGLIPELQRLHKHGIPFIGLSAGSIMLARAWVRWRDAQDDSTAQVFTALGIAGLYCDTHAEDDDWAELLTLLTLLPDETRGYGIPTGGALVVRPDGGVEARGQPAPCFVRRHSGGVRPLPPLRPQAAR